MGKLALQVLTDKLTAAWQLSCLPIWPQYCRATPTECLPCLGNPVSSTIHATTGPCFCIAGSTCRRTSARHLLDRSRARQPPHDAATGACDEHCQAPVVPPSAPRSCVLPATTIPCSSSSKACAGQRAPRRSPGPPYMPRSASLVGLARRGVIPQNNSTPNCLFITQ